MQELQQSASVQSNSDYAAGAHSGQHNYLSQMQGSNTPEPEAPGLT